MWQSLQIRLVLELKGYAEQLKRTLKLDYGVSLVDVAGFSDHQYRVELDTQAIRQLGLSVGDIAEQIGRQNVNLPSGNVETPDKNFLIRFDERRVTPEELETIVVGSGSEWLNHSLKRHRYDYRSFRIR